jgi:hypothetical protein
MNYHHFFSKKQHFKLRGKQINGTTILLNGSNRKIGTDFPAVGLLPDQHEVQVQTDLD